MKCADVVIKERMETRCIKNTANVEGKCVNISIKNVKQKNEGNIIDLLLI